MEKIRIGTIGSGVIVQHVLDNMAKVEDVCLEAVYSRSEEKGRALAEMYGTEKVYTRIDDLLADPEVNTIYIASPNLLHYEQTKRSLMAGKHVICEKPFCTKENQARELIGLARQQKLMLAEAAPTSFLPNFAALKEALPRIGRIRLVMANYSQFSSRYRNLLAGELPNIFNPEFAGGCLMDINYYNIYLTVALFGRPEAAVYHPNLYANGIDTSGVACLQYPDFQAVCIGAKDTWGVNAYQIEGEQGYLYVTDGSNGLRQIRIVTDGQEEIINHQPDPDRYYYELQTLRALMLAEDAGAFAERMEITARAVGVTEQMRKDCGLRFPGD
ncbi:MAG: Gfo/Idh/MocA family oxidoreductase [Parasporobacterium sp.]|nr:Gfo/Idh/MocA family oxidoreductase [Parasporobacterium sp.]